MMYYGLGLKSLGCIELEIRAKKILMTSHPECKFELWALFTIVWGQSQAYRAILNKKWVHFRFDGVTSGIILLIINNDVLWSWFEVSRLHRTGDTGKTNFDDVTSGMQIRTVDPIRYRMMSFPGV